MFKATTKCSSTYDSFSWHVPHPLRKESSAKLFQQRHRSASNRKLPTYSQFDLVLKSSKLV